MNSSRILQFLQQVPAGYPAVALVNGVAVPVTGFSFSHDPQEVRFELAPSAPTLTEPEPKPLCRVFPDGSPVPPIDYAAGFDRWWETEGKAMRPSEGNGLAVARRMAEIAWQNGAYVRERAEEFAEFPAPAPEPEATIAELNASPDEVMTPEEVSEAEAIMAHDPHAEPGVATRVTVDDEGVTVARVIEPDAGEVLSAASVPEENRSMANARGEYIAANSDQIAGRIKRTRKPKPAPAGTSDAT
jgi:hypothetical protein